MSARSSFVVLTGLQFRRLLRSRKPLLASIGVLVLATVLLLIRYLAPLPDDEVMSTVNKAWFGVLVYFIPFLFAGGLITEEIEARTLPYLLVRPVSRATLMVSKWLAATAWSVGLVVVGYLVTVLLAHVQTPALLPPLGWEIFRSAAALTLLATNYCAICLFWGAVAYEAAGILSLLHLIVVEFGLSFAPLFKNVTAHYLAETLRDGAPVPDVSSALQGLPAVAEVHPAIAVSAIVGLTVVWVGGAILGASIRDYHSSGQVG